MFSRLLHLGRASRGVRGLDASHELSRLTPGDSIVQDWLFEANWTLYIFLVVAALVLAALWLRDRKIGWLIAGSSVLLLLVVHLMMDWLVETRSEQIARKLNEMAAAVRKRDPEAIFRHIARKFQIAGQDRAAFRHNVEQALRNGMVTDLKLWAYDFSEPGGRVRFFAKPSGNTPGTEQYWLIRAEFVQEEPGQWRLAGFEVFNPFVNTDQPLTIPQWGR
jgi:hypothetical protein